MVRYRVQWTSPRVWQFWGRRYRRRDTWRVSLRNISFKINIKWRSSWNQMRISTSSSTSKRSWNYQLSRRDSRRNNVLKLKTRMRLSNANNQTKMKISLVCRLLKSPTLRERSSWLSSRRRSIKIFPSFSRIRIQMDSHIFAFSLILKECPSSLDIIWICSTYLSLVLAQSSISMENFIKNWIYSRPISPLTLSLPIQLTQTRAVTVLVTTQSYKSHALTEILSTCLNFSKNYSQVKHHDCL